MIQSEPQYGADDIINDFELAEQQRNAQIEHGKGVARTLLMGGAVDGVTNRDGFVLVTPDRFEDILVAAARQDSEPIVIEPSMSDPMFSALSDEVKKSATELIEIASRMLKAGR